MISTKKLQHLSNEELLNQTQFLASEEKRIDLAFIDHLREVERRCLFAEMAYSSLWDFCIRYLKLSEGSAQRKIAAMRLCRDLPEVKRSMEDGKLNVVNAAQLESFFNAEKKEGIRRTSEDKKAVVDQVLCLSQKDCQQRLAAISPKAALPKEYAKPLTAEKTQLRLILDSEAVSALNQLKDLLAHQVPSGTYSDLIHYMAKDLLKRIEWKRKVKVITAALSTATVAVKNDRKTEESPRVVLKPSELKPNELKLNELKPNKLKSNELKSLPALARRDAVPASIRQKIWCRSGGQCEYIALNGERCRSRFKLELDHLTPLALRGMDDVQNLRYTCRSHNQYLAIVNLGKGVMRKYYSWLA